MQLKGRVHLGGDFINAGIEDVGVDIHGGGELRVAEEFLSEFEVHTGLVERGRVAVADLVRGDGDTGALLVLRVVTGYDPVGRRRLAAVGGEDKTVFFIREDGSKSGQERNGTDTGGGLRLFDLRLGADVVDAAPDADAVFHAVDILIHQPFCLAASAAGIID